MTLVASFGWDVKVEKYMNEMQERVKCKLAYCGICHWPYYKHSGYQEDKCLECSGTHESYNREKRLEQHRVYQRKYVRVKRDKRRKENK